MKTTCWPPGETRKLNTGLFELRQHLTYRVFESRTVADASYDREFGTIGRPIGQVNIFEKLARLATGDGTAGERAAPIGTERADEEGEVAL